jgi:hypothetical protein
MQRMGHGVQLKGHGVQLKGHGVQFLTVVDIPVDSVAHVIATNALPQLVCRNTDCLLQNHAIQYSQAVVKQLVTNSMGQSVVHCCSMENYMLSIANVHTLAFK